MNAPTTKSVKLTGFALLKNASQLFNHASLPYMAPEVMLEAPNTSPFSVDIYSVGMILWELWNRSEPYEGMINSDGTNLTDMQLHVVGGGRPSLTTRVVSTDGKTAAPMPPEITHLIKRCWNQNLADRPNVDQVIAAFDDNLRDVISKAGDAPPMEITVEVDEIDENGDDHVVELVELGECSSPLVLLEEAGLGKYGFAFAQQGLDRLTDLFTGDTIDEGFLLSKINMSVVDIRRLQEFKAKKSLGAVIKRGRSDQAGPGTSEQGLVSVSHRRASTRTAAL